MSARTTKLAHPHNRKRMGVSYAPMRALAMILACACRAPVALDAGMPLDAAIDAMSDAGFASACGAAQPVVRDVRDTEGIVIARDGTIYYSQPSGIGRLLPGGVPEPEFVRMDGPIVALMLDRANTHLYAAAGGIQEIDLATLEVRPLVRGGDVRGMTLGPDYSLYFTDASDGIVYRIALSGAGSPRAVTITPIAEPRGLAFHEDGSLLVASFDDGTITRITLGASGESAREPLASVASAHGIAAGADGSIFVSSYLGAIVTRIADDGTADTIGGAVSVPSHIAFGAGALRCDDLYVTSQRELGRTMDVGPALAVPWQ